MHKHQKNSWVVSMKKSWSATMAIAGLSFCLAASVAYGQTTIEAENMTPISASAAGYKTSSTGAAGHGTYVEFNLASGIGDWIQFTFSGLSAGNYKIVVYYKSNNNRGIFQASLDGANIGSPVDEYAATAALGVPATITNSTPISTGSHNLMAKITGKNASSSGYGMTIDYFIFTLVTGPCTPVAISRDPSSISVAPNNTATFAVEASGTTPAYQWYYSTSGGSSFTPIPSNVGTGQTTPSYTTPATTTAMNGYRYRCNVSNTCPSSVTSATAILTVAANPGPSWKALPGVLYADPSTAKVGIGTNDPIASLQVQSSGTGLIVCDNNGPTQGAAVTIYPTKISLGSNTSSLTEITQFQVYVGRSDGAGASINPGSILAVDPSGSMTTIDGNSIRTNVVYVGTAGWSISAPDYVFSKDYNLMPLSKVEQFVAKNGHLPEIPSAKEMEEKKSVNLVEMNMKLLKKIEELTLHSIAQEKRIEYLEKKMEGK